MSTTKQGLIWRHPMMELTDLIELICCRISDQPHAWCLVTRIDHTDFVDLDEPSAKKIVEDWTQGRMFCESFEIRWRRFDIAGPNDVLFLCEDPALTPAGFRAIAGDWRVSEPGKDASLFAWGSPGDEESPHKRLESRLPRELNYPIGCNAGRVKCLYYRNKSDQVQLIRLMEVK